MHLEREREMYTHIQTYRHPFAASQARSSAAGPSARTARTQDNLPASTIMM